MVYFLKFMVYFFKFLVFFWKFMVYFLKRMVYYSKSMVYFLKCMVYFLKCMVYYSKFLVYFLKFMGFFLKIYGLFLKIYGLFLKIHGLFPKIPNYFWFSEQIVFPIPEICEYLTPETQKKVYMQVHISDATCVHAVTYIRCNLCTCRYIYQMQSVHAGTYIRCKVYMQVHISDCNFCTCRYIYQMQSVHGGTYIRCKPCVDFLYTVNWTTVFAGLESKTKVKFETIFYETSCTVVDVNPFNYINKNNHKEITVFCVCFF